MRLFHVSEEKDIRVFHPRRPTRKDLDPAVGLVWAVDEQRLPNFLTPRDCPRVAYHVREDTTPEDRERFFTCRSVRHAIIIEWGWLGRMAGTTLYLYEFAPEGFELQDPVAGYYVAKTTQAPIGREKVEDLLGALAARGVEIRITDSLWEIADQVRASSLGWSLCRMANARPKE